MDDNEKQAMRKILFEIRMQCIKHGDGGSEVKKIIKSYFAHSCTTQLLIHIFSLTEK
jgi:hypothetical protein